ncbi:MarR family transcriptional regulator [Halobacterium sp. KA-4]|jgi:DNA-binding MarR family transcriptional regulator|uniref:MarR family transcriptional regulator n=1 Tax=Halobacterium sp. KA-4 TaxID=2896367 RepID=UPI001E599402|nr:helix-turn-helix domain-containing protein [Halobacterium sp. KA-4]MCD2199206.1 MarR family transcriptional regulator [Halobacterium sp. KA-4]
MTTTDELVQDLPPSAKLVLKVLEYNGGLTQKQIVENSRLSQRTVRDALDRLQDADVVEKDIYIPDARQNLYRLSIDESEEDVEQEAEAEAVLD